jgi:hypothetical protein
MVGTCEGLWINGVVAPQRSYETQPAGLTRISAPDGHVQRLLELKDLTLGGLWPDWISLLPDDSPVITLDGSTEEISRLDLQHR